VNIGVKSLKRCDLVTLSGRFDSANAPEFDERLLELVEAGQRSLVVDMSDVSYVSSAALQALLHAQIRARKKVPQVHVVLAEAQPDVKDTLALVGFHHVFDMYDSVVEAVGSF
jgi:anti-sigma B factor antagonist